jgi:hypothetical protein
MGRQATLLTGRNTRRGCKGPPHQVAAQLARSSVLSILRGERIESTENGTPRLRVFKPFQPDELISLYCRAWGPDWNARPQAKIAEGLDATRVPAEDNGTNMICDEPTERTALTSVAERFANDRASIAACSKLIREGLEQEPNLSDVEQAISPMDVHPCIEKKSLRRVGIAASDSVLELLVRYPRVVLYTHLLHQRRLASKGEPVHPFVVAIDRAPITVRLEFLDLVAETLGQVYWIARNCRSRAEFFEIERQMWAEVESLQMGQIVPAASKLAGPKVDLQRWVVGGVYDHSVLGTPQVGIHVEAWQTDIALQGLSGEQRHRLIKRYRQNQDILDFLDGVLFYCARDPLDPHQQFFHTLAAVIEMRSTAARQLTQVALWLSGLIEGPESGPPRAGTDKGDLEFLLRAVQLASSDPDTLMVRQNIVAHFLWRNKQYWESAPGPSLYGFLGTSLKRAWLSWVRDGAFDDDAWIDAYGHSHKGKQKEILLGDETLDYIANREQIGRRSARSPYRADYNGDDDYARILEEYRTNLKSDRTAALSLTRRALRSLWLYKRPSSLNLGNFEKWIDPEVDIQRTFDRVYGVTGWSPVLLHEVPTSTVYQPTGFVRIGSKRAAQRAKRDADVFVMRICEDAKDGDIPLISGLSEREVAAAVKNLSDERCGEKIKKALRQGRTPVRRSPPGRSTGGAFGVACASPAISMFAARDFSGRSWPCKVTVRDGIELDQPAVLQVPPEEVHL